jgi:hypothetical protein
MVGEAMPVAPSRAPAVRVADLTKSFGKPTSAGEAAAWIGGLVAVFIALSVWRYRRMS